MLKDTLKTLYRCDLEKLKVEIYSYKKEENLWLTDKDVTNSAGNLTLHLIGNLNTYFGWRSNIKMKLVLDLNI